MTNEIQGGGDVITNDSGAQKPQILQLRWRATKGLPEGIAKKVMAGNAAYLEDFENGLSYWNADAKENVKIDKMTFVVLQVATKLEGVREAGDKYVSAYSNYVRDARITPFKVSERVGDSSQVIFNGFYDTFKNNKNDRDKHLKWTNCLICYCVELDQIVEVKSAIFINALCDATAKATNKKEVRVFNLSRYVRYELDGITLTDKHGEQWVKGEASISPQFNASGITKGREFIDGKFEEVKVWLDAHEAYHLENFKPQTAEDKMKADITAANNQPQNTYTPAPQTDIVPTPIEDLPF